MQGIPCICDRCGAVFEAPNVFGGAGTITLQSNLISCPNCGGAARIADGTFEFRAGGTQLLSGPQWTWQLVAALEQALRQIVEERPADPIAELVKINQEIAANVAEVVEVLKEANPRTTRRTIALKLAKWILATVVTATAGGVAARLIDGDPIPQQQEPEQTQTPDDIREEIRRQLDQILKTGKVPRPEKQPKRWKAPKPQPPPN